MSNILIYALGFLANGFFSARTLVQWIVSERARHVVSSSSYWILSIFGAYLYFIYGWLRDDFSIILGQVISYYIYIWNLNEKGLWRKMNVIIRIVLLLTPVVAAVMVLDDASNVIDKFFRNDKVPIWLLVYGSIGQVIFTLRFIYQWYYSKRRGVSLLPAGFWVISIVGCLIIVSYAFYRLDPVLALAQGVGLVAYGRNLFLARRNAKAANNGNGK